jgi:hypothetical protein
VKVGAYMRVLVLALGCLVAFPVQSRSGEEGKLKIAVLDLQSERGVDAGLVKLLNELLLTEFGKHGKYEVIGLSDIKNMLNLEQTKRLLDCTDTVCLSEVGGALGVERLGVASIGKVGGLYLVNVKVIDVRNSRVEGRVSHKVRGTEEELVWAITAAVQELVTGKPPPPRVHPAAADLQPPQEDERGESWYQKWWVWTLVGSVVCGGLVSTIVYLQGRDPIREPDMVRIDTTLQPFSP